MSSGADVPLGWGALIELERRAPDPEMGERVKAVVLRKPGSNLDEASIRAHVGAKLAAFKVPEFIEFVDKPLPRNPAGKILKDQLRGRVTTTFDPDFMH